MCKQSPIVGEVVWYLAQWPARDPGALPGRSIQRIVLCHPGRDCFYSEQRPTFFACLKTSTTPHLRAACWLTTLHP